MINSDLRKIFCKWIVSNQNQINYLPYIVEENKNSFTFEFSGIAHELKGTITDYGFFTIDVYYQNQLWDTVIDFDFFPQLDQNGKYYCVECMRSYKQGCIKRPPSFYISKEELWCKHSLQSFFVWMNKTLQCSNFICLNGGKRAGFWEARILPESKAYSGAWPVIIPVVGCKTSY